ncbi:MAG: hypothetical protein JWN39_120, partial [Ilumatobacteraceae bacterium]|nr:hypothetical protein [Ilumatobacteraceae bacterium]
PVPGRVPEPVPTTELELLCTCASDERRAVLVDDDRGFW